MQLCEELKLLYVALTRARNRVIIFDSSPDKRIPLFELLEKRNLARVASLQDIVPTKMGSDEAMAMASAECIEKGLELFKIGVFEEAKKCFRNGGDQVMEFKATARIKEREAVERDNAGTAIVLGGSDWKALEKTPPSRCFRSPCCWTALTHWPRTLTRLAVKILTPTRLDLASRRWSSARTSTSDSAAATWPKTTKPSGGTTSSCWMLGFASSRPVKRWRRIAALRRPARKSTQSESSPLIHGEARFLVPNCLSFSCVFVAVGA